MSDSSGSTNDSAINSASPCPCTSGAVFSACCQPLLAGAEASTAEVLMRSRYTAFVLHDANYLLHSWHPDTRPAQIDFDPRQRWLGLKIKSSSAGQRADRTGVVCFAARYKRGSRGHRLEECSRFVRLCDSGTERWVYVDGEVAD